MKRKDPSINKEDREVESIQTKDLDKAIERIREEYGNDLSAFYRDARASVLRRNEKLIKKEPCLM